MKEKILKVKKIVCKYEPTYDGKTIEKQINRFNNICTAITIDGEETEPKMYSFIDINQDASFPLYVNFQDLNGFAGITPFSSGQQNYIFKDFAYCLVGGSGIRCTEKKWLEELLPK